MDIDIQNQLNTSILASYMEISSIDGSGNPLLIEFWDNNTKNALLYSRDIEYTNELPTKITVTDIVRGRLFVTDISYDGVGEIISVEKSISDVV